MIAAVKAGAALIAAAGALIPGCQPPSNGPTCQVGYSVVNDLCVPDADFQPEVVPPAANSVIVVWESVGVTGPVDPPTRLDMWMEDTDNEGGPRVRCLNRGGEPKPVQGLILCEGIDY